VRAEEGRSEERRERAHKARQLTARYVYASYAPHFAFVCQFAVCSSVCKIINKQLNNREETLPNNTLDDLKSY